MAEEKSWRTEMENPFLGSWDVPEDTKQLVVEFTEIKFTEKIPEFQGASKFLGNIKGQSKKMVLNTTNMKRLESMFGSDKKSDWLNKPVTLGLEKVRDVQSGETVDALRVVKQKAPPPKQPIKPEQWPNALAAAKKDPAKKQEILDTRQLTPEQKTELDAI